MQIALTEGGWMRVKLAGAGRQLRNREETRRFVGFVGLNPHRYERVMEQVDITVLETVAEKRGGS